MGVVVVGVLRGFDFVYWDFGFLKVSDIDQ